MYSYKKISVQDTFYRRLSLQDTQAQLKMEALLSGHSTRIDAIKERFLQAANEDQRLKLAPHQDPLISLFTLKEIETYSEQFAFLHGAYLFRMQEDTLVPVILHASPGIDRPGNADQSMADYTTYVWSENSPERPHRLQSITKSIASLMLREALKEKGAPSLLDKPLNQYIVEADYASYDLSPVQKTKIQENLSRITVAQILNMSSGIVYEPIPNIYESPLPPWIHPLLGEIIYPGKYSYSDGDSNLLGKVIECLTGHPTISFAEETLFQKCRLTEPTAKFWSQDTTPFFCCSGGLSLSAIDLAKIGQYTLQKIKEGDPWMHRIQEDGIHFKTEPDKIRPDAKLVMFEGYSHYWWHFETEIARHKGKPVSCLMAQGIGGQKCFIIPELNLIFITQGGFYNAHGEAMPPLYAQSRRLLEALITPYLEA